MPLSHSDLSSNNIDDINFNDIDNSQSFETPHKHNQNVSTIYDTKTQRTHHKAQNRIPSSQQNLTLITEESPRHISEEDYF